MLCYLVSDFDMQKAYSNSLDQVGISLEILPSMFVKLFYVWFVVLYDLAVTM